MMKFKNLVTALNKLIKWW